jgi:ABC-type amino acid transport substrate-binding protein
MDDHEKNKLETLPYGCRRWQPGRHCGTVLERVAAGGKLVIAHRESSVPFSFLDDNKNPVGYAVDLCLKLAEAVCKKTGTKNMALEFLPVTSTNRIDPAAQSKADLECGSTTNNAERREKVAFTTPHLSRARTRSAFDRREDLEGKKLVSTKGPTPLKAAEQANRERLLRVTLLEAPNPIKAVEMVEQGEADAFVMDDVLLYGLAGRANPDALKSSANS